MNKDAFKMMCNAYTDDEVCNACCNNSVMAKQSCYVKPVKPGAERDSVDKVHPDHYKLGNGREVIDEMIILFGRERVADWCRLTAYKYLYRHGNKKGESTDTDMAKMDYYLTKAEELTEYE